MTTSKLVRSPVVHRSGAVLAAAFLLAAGTHQASAAPSASSGSDASSGGSVASACPDQVQITLGRMSVSGGMVTISFSHNAHNCPAARPARLHIHQNLVSAPQAGSDPEHQWNADLDIGPSHGDGVTVPLLASADGKCFVQVDAHTAGQSPRGKFFPTTTCSSATPSSPASSSPVPSSTAPSTTASSSTGSSSTSSSSTVSSSTTATSTAETSTAQTSTAQTSTAPVSSSAVPSRTSQSFLPESTSRTTATQSFFPVGQVQQSPPAGSLASTGSRTVLPAGVGAIFLIAGAWLLSASRRPRRH